MIVVRAGVTPDVRFTAARQHRFGNPRYYEWSGWDEEETAFHDGRALPFDLVVGPPQPPFRGTAYEENDVLTTAIAAADTGVARARRQSAGAAINTIDLFHPIVVVDASMRAVDDESTIPLQWCRLERHFIAGDSRWVDVMQESAFAEALARIVSAYGCLLQRLGCLPAAA